MPNKTKPYMISSSPIILIFDSETSTITLDPSRPGSNGKEVIIYSLELQEESSPPDEV